MAEQSEKPTYPFCAGDFEPSGVAIPAWRSLRQLVPEAEINEHKAVSPTVKVMQGGEHSPEVLTLEESAVVLRCSKTHVSNLVNGRVPSTPRLPHFRLGRRVLIRRERIDRWMEENKEQ